MSVVIFQFFSYKIEKNRNDKKCVLCHSFWSNKDSNILGTSKQQSEPQFYVVAKRMARNGLKIANSLGCAFHFESEFRFMSINRNWMKLLQSLKRFKKEGLYLFPRSWKIFCWFMDSPLWWEVISQLTDHNVKFVAKVCMGGGWVWKLVGQTFESKSK